MQPPSALLALLLVLTAGLSALAAGSAWRRADAPAARPFAAFMLALAVCELAYAGELVLAGLAGKSLMAGLAYLGTALLPTAWFVAALAHTRGERALTRPLLALLAFEPLLVLGLVFSNEAHGLMWRELTLVRWGPVDVLRAERGPGFWLLGVYSYALIGVGSALLFRAARRAPRPLRQRAVALLLGAVVPWAAHAAYLVGPQALRVLDLTPLAFMPSALWIGWSLFRRGLFDLLPVVREIVLEQMADGVIVLDAGGRVLDLNPAARGILAPLAGEPVGQAAGEVFAEHPALLRCLAGAPEVATEIGLGTGSAARRYDLRITPFGVGAASRIGKLVVLHDITTLKEAIADVELSESRHGAILDSALDCVITMDHEGRIVEFNPAAERTLGYSRQEVLGRTVEETIVPEEYRDQHRRGLANYRATGHGPVVGIRVEFPALRKDGTTFPAEIAVSVAHQGDTPYFTAYMRDITERQAGDRLKDELIATVSHELRTPLTSLRGFAELMLERNLPPERRRKFLTVIHSEAARLTRLLDDFLDLKRIETGSIKYTFGPVDLRQLLEDAITAAAGEGSDHQFSLFAPEGVPPVRADVDRIRQVISNLLSNAVKFSPDGGRVGISIRHVGGAVTVSVEDEGIGIAPKEIEKIFTKFYRADNAETRRIGGTGLGLALVREVVEAHGGSIWVESESGGGSSFRFALPLAEADAGPGDEEDMPEFQMRPKQRGRAEEAEGERGARRSEDEES